MAVLALGDRAQELGRPPAPGYGGLHHFTIADQLRGEPGRAAAFAGRTSQDQRVAAIFDNGMCVALAIRAGYLGNGLKTENAAASEFSKARKRVLEPVDLAQGVQFVDHEPEAAIRTTGVGVTLLLLVHRLKYRQTHPRRHGRTQGRDLTGSIRHE